MQIPQHLQHYAEPTVVAIGDFEHVKLYLAHGDTIEDIETMKAPEPKEPDDEGAYPFGQHRFSSPSADRDEGVRREKFARSLAERLAELLRDGDARRIKLAMPTEACRRVQEELPNELKDAVVKVVDEDLVYLPLVDALERIAAK